MNHFDLEKQLLIELEVKNILSTQFSDVYYSGSSYNFRCHICGDSENKFKKRGHIYTTTSPWIYHCYNGDCNAHMKVEYWLKTYFNFEYQRIMKELMKLKTSSRDAESANNLQKRIDKIKFKKLKKKVNEKKDVSFFKPIYKFPNLIEYCKNRKIPENVFNKWYYAVDGFYKNRIIITFIKNETGKIYYYQGRDMDNNSKCKYLSRVGKNLNPIYNYYNVDKNKPVIILEGPIDSVFIDNSIGLTGLKDKTEELKDFPFKYYLLDNDKSGFDKSIQLLSNGDYVFNWKKFLKDYPCTKDVKDVNDFIKYNTMDISKLTFEILKPYFTNNNFHKVFFI